MFPIIWTFESTLIITAHGSCRSLTDMQSGSVRQLSVRVVSNLRPPLVSITGTICSLLQSTQPPLWAAPCRTILCQLRNHSCEVCLWKRRDSLCRKRNLEQVWLSQKRKNRACLCTSEPSWGGSVNPFIPGQFGHVTRQHQFISTTPHRLAQNNPPPPLSSTNHDPQCTGTIFTVSQIELCCKYFSGHLALKYQFTPCVSLDSGFQSPSR